MKEKVDDDVLPVGDRLLTVRQTMSILHVCRSTLYALARRGLLHPIHIGRALRFRAEDVRDYLAALREAEAGKRG